MTCRQSGNSLSAKIASRPAEMPERFHCGQMSAGWLGRHRPTSPASSAALPAIQSTMRGSVRKVGAAPLGPGSGSTRSQRASGEVGRQTAPGDRPCSARTSASVGSGRHGRPCRSAMRVSSEGFDGYGDAKVEQLLLVCVQREQVSQRGARSVWMGLERRRGRAQTLRPGTGPLEPLLEPVEPRGCVGDDGLDFAERGHIRPRPRMAVPRHRPRSAAPGRPRAAPDRTADRTRFRPQPTRRNRRRRAPGAAPRRAP